ncbi:MAG: hypothetical protein ACTSX6_04780 [Candidatus Heimdallarchaeaceae archaeon]
MKAKQDFVIHVTKDTGDPISYKEGEPMTNIKKIVVKKGDEVPEDILQNIYLFNRDFLEIQYKDGVPVLPKELQDKKSPPLIPKRKYSMESLHKVYEKKGLQGLKEIGAKFDPPITDRSHKRLISEILTAQEKIQREGKR